MSETRTKTLKVVRDPKAIELIADETRRRMIYLLRVKEMSASQIAKELDLTPQAIYHHLRKMVDAGLVEVAREERIGHFIETYYRATAEFFQFTHGETSTEFGEAQLAEAIKALARLGLTMEVEEKKMAEIVELGKQLESMGLNPDLEAKIENMEDVPFFTKQYVLEAAKQISMSDKQFEEMIRAQRDLREVLKSLMVKSKKTENAPTPLTK